MSRAQYILENYDLEPQFEFVGTLDSIRDADWLTTGQKAALLGLIVLIKAGFVVGGILAMNKLDKFVNALGRAERALKDKSDLGDPELKRLKRQLKEKKKNVDAFIKKWKKHFDSRTADPKDGPSDAEMAQQRKNWSELSDAVNAYVKAAKAKHKAAKKALR